MKCARCGTSLDDGVMVCSQCGAVVGMNYANRPAAAKPATPPKPGTLVPRATARTGTTKALVQRVKDILLSPRAEWTAIAAEPVSATDVWLGYVLPLALIGPIALAVAQVVFGTSFPLVGLVKAPLVTGVATALLAFAFTLVQVAVLAWAVNAMAHRFGATPDPLGALQVVAYSMTPVWLVGIFYLLPPLGVVWMLAALYAFTLCLFGLRTVMQCPQQQALGYAGTTLGIAFVLWAIAGSIVTAIMGFGPVIFD